MNYKSRRYPCVRFKQGFSVPPVDQNKYYYQVKTKVVLSCDGEMNNNSFILNDV
jgi:hypothetical protein